jgi:hypothetical protein
MKTILPVQQSDPANRINKTNIILHGLLVSAVHTGNGRALLQDQGYL